MSNNNFLSHLSSIRVGHGYDAHRLEKGCKLILGGVQIPYESGLAGHSDADVLVHAVIDSLLGASALGDIGNAFPDNDAQYKGINSIILLERALELIRKKRGSFEVLNIDCTIVAQKPKLSPFKEDMRENLARVLNVKKDAVSIKAKTEEGMGFTGNGEGMSSHCVCLLVFT